MSAEESVPDDVMAGLRERGHIVAAVSGGLDQASAIGFDKGTLSPASRIEGAAGAA